MAPDGVSDGVAVVVPCFRVRRHIGGVLAGLIGRVAAVYVVDDACPEGTGAAVRAQWPGAVVLEHAANQGVGGAVLTGYARALADGHAVVVKMDGDGQMDPAHLEALTRPVLRGEAGYAKGDRFAAWPRSMPPARVLGNLVASAVMGVRDPCNGYTAIGRGVLARLPLAALERRWFFECDMLGWMAAQGVAVRSVPIPARYGDETSGLTPLRAVREFSPRFAARLLRRAW